MFVLFVDEVQGPAQVRITDFGLAKLLNHDEEQYQATGEKVYCRIKRNISQTAALILFYNLPALCVGKRSGMS